MHLQSFLVAAMSVPAVFAALNEPCYGSGGRAGSSHFSNPTYTFTDKNIRRLRDHQQLLIQRRHHDQRRLPQRPRQPQMLHQSILRQRRQLSLHKRLRRHLCRQSVPGSQHLQVLRLICLRLRRLRRPEYPDCGRLQVGRRQRRQEDCGGVPEEGSGDLLHARLYLSWRLGSLLWQGDGYDVL